MNIFYRMAAALCAAALLTGAEPAQAQTPVTYTDGGQALFSFDIPDFWLLRSGGPREIEDTALGDPRAVNRVLGLRPVTDENAWMGFVSPEGVGTIDGGLRYLREIDKFLVKDPVVKDNRRLTIGGLPAQVISGQGRRDGAGVNFTATVIDLPRNRVAIAVSILRNGVDPNLVDDMNAVFASFRATR